jgi:hypothetical protein
MHWPTATGVGEEHWWIEIRSGRPAGNYTVEIFPAINSLYIYGPRRPDPTGYATVRVPLAGLLQTHIDRINQVLVYGALEPTNFDGSSYGWS